MNDKVGNADMKLGSTGSYVYFRTDRFGNINEAFGIFQRNSYTYVQPGSFFTTPQFSISFWVFSNEIFLYDPNNDSGSGSGYPVFGFGPNDNNIANNDIIFYLTRNFTFSPSLQIWNSTSIVVNCQTSNSLWPEYENKWLHLVATYDGLTANIYINGSLASSVNQSYSLPVITRYFNYFGRDYTNNYTNHYPANFYLDDIRFYSISLTPKQIQNIMNITEKDFV